MVRYGSVWFGMVRYDTLLNEKSQESHTLLGFFPVTQEFCYLSFVLSQELLPSQFGYIIRKKQEKVSNKGKKKELNFRRAPKKKKQHDRGDKISEVSLCNLIRMKQKKVSGKENYFLRCSRISSIVLFCSARALFCS